MKKLVSIVAGVTLGLSACGDPVGTNSGDVLTPAEVEAVFEEFGNAFGGVDTGESGGAPLRAGEQFSVAQATPFSASVNIQVPCALGGSLAFEGDVSGDVDQQTGQGDVGVDLTWILSDCAIEADENTITVNTDPNINVQVDFERTDSQVTVQGSKQGGFSFTSSDGRSGSCGVDIEFDFVANIDGSGVSGSVSGTVCGVTVDNSLDVGVV